MSSANARKKIIIDTDPGVDDAMAIIMALDAHKKQRIEVIAITLVKGNCSLKDAERNILRVLEVFGLEDTVRFTFINFYSPLFGDIDFDIIVNLIEYDLISDSCIRWKRKQFSRRNNERWISWK